MAITRAQLEAASEALALVLRFDRPADAVLHDFFGARRALGAHDRVFVADSVFGILRRKRTVDRLAAGGSARQQLLAYLVRPAGLSVRELSPLIAPGEREWLGQVRGTPLDSPDPSARAELPGWIATRLAALLGEEGMLAAARGLNEPAPLDLRVNTLRAQRDEVLSELNADGLAADATPYSPVGVRIRGRPPINRHRLFVTGAVEVQDEGSQLLGYLMAPRRTDLVVDFCAGAGGKSLHIGALMRSRGRIYAFDTSAARLARLKPRLARSGLSNLHSYRIANENDLRVKRLAGKADRVLIDAPCSGLGTLRRNPDLKWRQSEHSIGELSAKQAGILRAAAALLKPGGRLVYATCSFLREENDDIVAAFLEDHVRFRTLPASDLLGQQKIPLDTGVYLKLWPHLHGTDGFFATVMERSA